MNGNPNPNRNPNQQRPTQGQQRPMQGQQRPMQGQQRPMQNQQRPMQGQQRPMQGQQRPMQNQQRPMQGKQRPMQGQQRPMQNQQRPMQNQQRPMQGKQRPMQGSQRPPQNNGGSSYGAILKLAIITVAVILLLSLIIGVVVVAMNADEWFDPSPSPSYNDDGDEDDTPETKKPSSGDTTKTDVVKANITLPSATPSGSYLSSSSGAAEITGISSAAGILVDMKSNSVLAVKNANTKIYPASMTKVMTLLVACEMAEEAGKLLTVEQWMIDYQQKMGASGKMGFKKGEQISVESALYLIIYDSDTISCLLIADYIAGGEAEFVNLMNEKARNLGLTNTHFSNTTGLHSDDHYTTCREMAAIMNCAMSNPVARKILTAYSGKTINVFVDGKLSRSPTRYSSWYSDDGRFNDNPKISGTSMKAIAGKTGYEDIPTACFVTAAQDTSNNREYICVVVGRIDTSQGSVGTSTSTSDTVHIYKNYVK